MKPILPTALCLILFSCSAQDSQILNKDWQISTAVLVLEEENRDNATVLGFNKSGELVTLREGTNNFICLADDPGKDGFSVSAYHKDLEPFMARGRVLRREGKSFQEVFDIREEEVKSGKLSMPDKSTLYVMNAELDESGDVINSRIRFVVYIPFATPESTGLPLKPLAPGAPWIMDPGTHRAHIMITPPPKN